MVKVPFALDNKGSVGFPQTANRESKWKCPSCTSDVIVKRGSILVPHFAHKNTASTCIAGESLAHRATKEWVASIVASPAFKIIARCSDCNIIFDAFRGSPEFTGHTEVKIDAYRIDAVAKQSDGSVEAAFEVYHTHKTNSQKMRTLMAFTKCKAFEIEAVPDLVAAGYPITFESIRPLRCKICMLSSVAQYQCRYEYKRLMNARAFGRKWKQLGHKRLIRARAIGRKWKKITFDAIQKKQQKFLQRWMFLTRAPTVASRAKALHILDEKARIKPCTACRKGIETFKWVKDQKAPWGYKKKYLDYLVDPNNVDNPYHLGCKTPWCKKCFETVKPGKWCKCQRSIRRKCTDCNEWGLIKNMHSFVNPPRSDFPKSWVCDACGMNCRLCHGKISRAQAKFGGACYTCNIKAKQQQMGELHASEFFCHCGKRKNPNYRECYVCSKF